MISNYADCRRLMDPTITPNPLARIRCAGGTDTGNACLSDAQMATVDAFHASDYQVNAHGMFRFYEQAVKK